MRSKLIITFTFAWLLLLGGCQGNANVVAGQQDLLGHAYVLSAFDGTAFNTDIPEAVYIEFSESFRVSGKICNNFTGMGELVDGRLLVRQMASTRMLCAYSPLNELESTFSQMLMNGADLRLEGNLLTLSGQGHELVFSQRDWVD